MKKSRGERGEGRESSRGQWPVVRGQRFSSFPREAWKRTALDDPRRCSLSTNGPPATDQRPVRRGFTLVELLVTISLVAMLAAMVFGALSMARESGREAATKATIAKLNTIIMRRYESYMTRRVPIRIPPGTAFRDAAMIRLYAIRDIMRMEMPDRSEDINDPPIALPYGAGSVPRPALNMLYYNRLNNFPPGPGTGVENGAAELLYMIVSLGSPETIEQFSQSEIGDTNSNGYPEFLDGWGRPIFFIRWAPGFSPYSDIQPADLVNYHDPFDPLQVDHDAYQLIPLIYSGGPNSDPGLRIENDHNTPSSNYHFGGTATQGAMFTDSIFPLIGSLPGGATSYGGITNHRIEAR